ncbi:hypothetical protein [Mucilaginibacter ginsenosidivorax]|uniref:Uncharacterized protein n=1 Tax=Mucilaginibacter ginsenosidivorax TaxID=862126 RepID=A0A5B8W5W4_9SPHI|nr:hypothetical protein [Mucilaginibacter ginsenosidivorax]QEC78837.1 hypothetical protein FSB76_23850 [Mucilaginibacter ginsenosidivorax]
MLIFFSACGRNQNDKIQRSISTSIDSLKRLIDFHLDVKAVRWEMMTINNEDNRSIPGPNDNTLFAEIEISRIDYNTLKDNFIKGKANIKRDVYLRKDFVKDWFSPKVKSVFYEENEYIRINVPVYELNNEIIGKTYFRDGFFSLIGGDKIFILLDK